MPYQPVRNPFPGLGPIRAGEPGFYPRAGELLAVQELLRAGDSVSLVGERKAGKTSFLHYLSRNLSPDAFIPVYVDGQRIMPQSDAMFLETLLRSAATALAQAQQLDTQHEHAATVLAVPSPVRDFQNSLLALIEERFNLPELRAFCFALGVDYDNLGGDDTLSGKSRALIGFMRRRALWRELVRTGRQLRPDAPWPQPPDDAQPEAGPPLALAGASVFGLADQSLYRAFEDHLEALRARLPRDENGRPRRMVWLIDEIETLQGYKNTELFVFLRPFAQADPDFRFVVAGYDVLYTLATQGDWSPFYNAFRLQRLRALEPPVARALVTDALAAMGATAPATLINEVLAESGKKPFYLKVMMGKLAEALNERGAGYRLNRRLLNRARALFLADQDVDQVFRHQWERHTSPRQRGALSLMAVAPHLETPTLLLEEMKARGLADAGGQTAQGVLDDLVRLEQLAFFDVQLDRYRFTSQYLREWIALNKPLE